MSDQVFTLELPAEASAVRVAAKGNPWQIAGSLFSLAKDKLLEAITLPSRDEVLKAAGDAFDKYVAPLDVPFIPNIIEPTFDAMMRKAFIDSVGKLYDVIAASKNSPVPA